MDPFLFIVYNTVSENLSMTCIVGLIENGKIYLGGDSAAISNDEIIIRKDIKIITKDNFIIGFSGSYRMGQLLRYEFSTPAIDGMDLMQYMVTKFVESLRNCFEKNKFTDNEWIFLIGSAGRLFTIYRDYQVAESVDNYSSCGSGWMLARGSLYTTGQIANNMSPESRIEMALQAAEKYNTGVRGPFHIMSL